MVTAKSDATSLTSFVIIKIHPVADEISSEYCPNLMIEIKPEPKMRKWHLANFTREPRQ